MGQFPFNEKSSSFFSKLYVDEEVEELADKKKYSVYTCPTSMVYSSLGSAGLESFVCDIFRICRCAGEFVGVAENELRAYEENFHNLYYTQKLIDRGYLRRENIDGINVLFPTEELLINQKVGKFK